MNNVNFKIGGILLGENNHPRNGNHYIVYFDELDGVDFIGCMISTKLFGGKNILMQSSHFETENELDGTEWLITFNDSHLVIAKLHKFNEMGNFIQVGQLTAEGIGFMKEVIKDLPLLTWDEYLKLSK